MSTPAEHPAPESPRTYSAPAGLTTPGVFVVVLAGSLVGLLLDVFTGGGTGWIFAIALIASSAYAAVGVRPSDRLAAVSAPPLVFAGLMLLDNLIAGNGDLVTRLANAANDLLKYGPMLWIAETVTIAVVGTQIWLARSRGRTTPLRRTP